MSDVDEIVKEWEELIETIPVLEDTLETRKRLLVVKQLTEDTKVDYKELYGANNEKVRKHHYNLVLTKEIEDVNTSQHELDTAIRKLSLLKFLAYMKLDKDVL